MTEANVKTDRVGNTKQTFHKERDFARNYFFFESFASV